jgi:hypothetical protein
MKVFVAGETPPLDSAGLHRLHVLHHDRLGLVQLLGGAEEHQLGAGLMLHGDVAWRRVERVAGLEDLFAIGVAKGRPAADDVAPMRALAAVVRKPLGLPTPGRDAAMQSTPSGGGELEVTGSRTKTASGGVYGGDPINGEPGATWLRADAGPRAFDNATVLCIDSKGVPIVDFGLPSSSHGHSNDPTTLITAICTALAP